jgi:hypothetical protein
MVRKEKIFPPGRIEGELKVLGYNGQEIVNTKLG